MENMCVWKTVFERKTRNELFSFVQKKTGFIRYFVSLFGCLAMNTGGGGDEFSLLVFFHASFFKIFLTHSLACSSFVIYDRKCTHICLLFGRTALVSSIVRILDCLYIYLFISVDNGKKTNITSTSKILKITAGNFYEQIIYFLF